MIRCLLDFFIEMSGRSKRLSLTLRTQLTTYCVERFTMNLSCKSVVFMDLAHCCQPLNMQQPFSQSSGIQSAHIALTVSQEARILINMIQIEGSQY